MTCHVARRIGDLERRLCRERREASCALFTTDAELASCERVGDSLDDSATETACRVLTRLDERDLRVITEVDAAERRLSAGSFGVCEACPRPSPVERVGALLTGRLC